MANYVTVRGYRVDSRSDKKSEDKEFDYLKPKLSTQEALDALQEAVNEDNAKDEPERNCYDKSTQFSNYDDPRSLYDIPTDSQARRMCGGCPLFDLCKDYATKARPAWGVWGGKVYGRNLNLDD